MRILVQVSSDTLLGTVSNYRNPSIHIWTRVGEELLENTKFQIGYDVAQRHFKGQITDKEFVNAIFEPQSQEQVNEKQAELLAQFSPLLLAYQQRFMSVQAQAAHRLTFL